MPNKLRRLCCALLAAAAMLCFPLAAGAYYNAQVVSAGNCISTGQYAPPTPDNGVTVDGNTVTVTNSSTDYACRVILVAQGGQEVQNDLLTARTTRQVTLTEGQTLYVLGQYQTLAGLGEHSKDYQAAVYQPEEKQQEVESQAETGEPTPSEPEAAPPAEAPREEETSEPPAEGTAPEETAPEEAAPKGEAGQEPAAEQSDAPAEATEAAAAPEPPDGGEKPEQAVPEQETEPEQESEPAQTETA